MLAAPALKKTSAIDLLSGGAHSAPPAARGRLAVCGGLIFGGKMDGAPNRLVGSTTADVAAQGFVNIDIGRVPGPVQRVMAVMIWPD